VNGNVKVSDVVRKDDSAERGSRCKRKGPKKKGQSSVGEKVKVNLK
jgi:hypothetical protein